MVVVGLVLAAIAAFVVAVTLASGGGSSGAHNALDAKTLSVSSVPVRGGPQGIAVGEGSVWVAAHDRNAILQLDEKDGSSDGAPINLAGSPSAITTGGGYVWAIIDNDAVTRVDPDSREVTGTPVKLAGISPSDIEFGEGYVWVLESSDVVQIDPAKLTIKKTYKITPTGDDIAVGDGVVWVPGENIEAGQSRIDVASGHVSTGGVPLTGSVASGFDAGWSYDDDEPTGARVLRLDPRNGRQLGITKLNGGSGAIATGAGAVWILDTSNQRLTRIDPKTSKIAGAQTAVPTGSDSRLAIGDDAAWFTSSDAVTRIGF
jgi:streptogramin lyase